MTLFGIGPLELVVIIILALIFLGPEELPVVARKTAKLLRDLQALSTELTEQVREELGPELEELAKAKEELEEVSKQAKRVQTVVTNPTQMVKQEIEGALKPTASPSSNDESEKRAEEPPTPDPVTPRISKRPLAPPTTEAKENPGTSEGDGQ